MKSILVTELLHCRTIPTIEFSLLFSIFSSVNYFTGKFSPEIQIQNKITISQDFYFLTLFHRRYNSMSNFTKFMEADRVL